MLTDLTPIRITRPDDENLRGVGIEQLRSGHLRSPWFTFSGSGSIEPEAIYCMASTFQAMREAAVRAFAEATGQAMQDISVNVRPRQPGQDYFWCLTTRWPCEWPRRNESMPKKPEAPCQLHRRYRTRRLSA